MEYHIKDENGQEYLISERNGLYEFSKIMNGEKNIPSIEEIKFISEEIKKISLKPRDYENLKNDILQAFREGKITSYNELVQYIKNLNLDEKIEKKLIKNGLGELDIEKIIYIKNKMLEILRNPKSNDIKTFVNFNIKSNPVDLDYCEIKITHQDGETSFEHLKETLCYTETLEKELIEPILLEISLQNEVITNRSEKQDNDINNRANYYLENSSNMSARIVNTSLSYANKLEQLVQTKTSIKEGDSLARDVRISEIQDEEQKSQEQQNYNYDQNGVAYDEEGNRIGKIIDGELVKENIRIKTLTQNNYNKGQIPIALLFLFTTIIIVVSMTICFTK